MKRTHKPRMVLVHLPTAERPTGSEMPEAPRVRLPSEGITQKNAPSAGEPHPVNAREIAERVYRLLRDELRREQERRGRRR